MNKASIGLSYVSRHLVTVTSTCLLLVCGCSEPPDSAQALAEGQSAALVAPTACGGPSRIPCADHTQCLDDPSDNCDPRRGGINCPGICAGFCGGFAGFGCMDGTQCVDDPADSCDPKRGAADCPGVCVAKRDCSRYPIAVGPDPAAQGAAEEELQRLSPGATMTWSPERGTFSIVNLRAPLDLCPAGDDVFAHLFPLTQTYPRLFQLSLAEWQSPRPVLCSEVRSDRQNILQIRRTKVGSHPVTAHDVMNFVLSRVGSVVELRTVVGNYVPRATPDLDATLSSCPELDPNRARGVAQSAHFSYTIHDPRSLCVPEGIGRYSPNARDTLDLDAGAVWSWAEDPSASQVLFTKNNPAVLFLDPSNYTPEILRSDANCGSQGVGFELTFDAVTSQISYSKPGPGCIVCLR